MSEFNIQLVIGMSEEDARENLKLAGFKTRLRKKDGVPFMGTCDYTLDRVNIEIVNDKVISANIG